MPSPLRSPLSLVAAAVLTLLWLAGIIASMALGPWVGALGVIIVIVALTVAFAICGDLVTRWIGGEPHDSRSSMKIRDLAHLMALGVLTTLWLASNAAVVYFLTSLGPLALVVVLGLAVAYSAACDRVSHYILTVQTAS